MPLTPKGKKIQAAMKKQYLKKVSKSSMLPQKKSKPVTSIDWAKKKQARTVKLAPGGAAKSKSRVNEAGNYTKPGMRKRQFQRIKAGSKGGAPGQWSARKAQMLASAYKKAGGGYRN